ncbi:MAG TPA: HAD-IC family P-type ATPase, partial [Elusimicrobiales bacterium]|nr:HAD-IC family P-type ATPase [Elusimicrobiales bacterium]
MTATGTTAGAGGPKSGNISAGAHIGREILTEKGWHALEAGTVLEKLGVDASLGLSPEEAVRRREIFGRNALTPRKGKPAWLRFLLQFHQPLIYILLASALITFVLKEWVDGTVIAAVVIINAVVGFLQEAKALKALEALSRSMTTQSTVRRGGVQIVLPSTELVPGDIAIIASGDKVPADMRLLKTRELRVNESALTGESLPVPKTAGTIDLGAALADRSDMAFTSSLATYGQGEGVVVATGDRTEVGRISDMISSAEDLATPLTRKIERFSHLMLYAILAMAVLTFLVGVLRGRPTVETFMAAVALAVGLIPEGLPAAVTITLAIGVSRMAARRAIIRKLPAVETLGSTMVICSDKTGTLTENQMTVQSVRAGGREYAVGGTGYRPAGEFSSDGRTVSPLEVKPLRDCLTAGLLCNTARITEKNGVFGVEGDPTEGALIASAGKAGITEGTLGPLARRIDTLPFESEHKYMATLHDGAPGAP